MEYKLQINKWPESERPRERLLEHGPEHLSDAELLTILLRVGDRGKSAYDLAKELLIACQGLHGLDAKSVHELCEMKGIGMAKAAQIKAALELAKRLHQDRAAQREHFQTSRDIFEYMRLRVQNQPREQFFVLLLTSRNRLLSEKKLFEGTLHESQVNAREVVKLAINEQAGAVAFVHNHPSGQVTPSADDIGITKKLQHACSAVDIVVLDHVIVAGERYFSFADEGML
jgi:DNA repair protein RadC